MTVVPILSAVHAHSTPSESDAACTLLQQHLRSALTLADNLNLQLVGIDICQALERLGAN